MTKLIVIVVLLAGLSGAAAFVYDRFGGEAEDAGLISEGGLYTVRRDDLKITITENGTLMAKESKKVMLETDWQGKITSLVEEGKNVEEGEVLCQMDTKDITSRIEQIELDIVAAEANLKASKTEVEIQITENEGTLEQAKITLEKAEKDLERYVDGDAPQERRKLKIGIKDAETGFERAKKKFEDSQRLVKEDYISKTELKNHEIEFEKAEVQLQGAHLDEEMFEKYTYPITLKDKQTALSKAKRDLGSAEKRTESALAGKQVRVQQNTKRLTKLQKRFKKYKEDLEKMTLKAPCPGIVIYGDPKNSWMRQRIKIGGEVWGGNTIFTIPDLRVMQVKLGIHEADINKIKLDQKARVTMETYPGVILSGKVTKIASIANSGNPNVSQAEVKKFDVIITIDEQPDGLTLKPGISAKAEIHIEDRSQVLFVPLQSVFLEDGEHFCHVAVDGRPQKRKVEAGLANDSFIEVTGGLEEGDRVLLYNPEFGADSGPAESEGEESPAPVEAAPGGPPPSGPQN